MAISIPDQIAQTEDINVSNTIGDLTVGTANVPVQGKYLTVVIRNGKPFDMALSDTIKEAMEAHEYFLVTAAMFAAMKGKGGDEIPMAPVNRDMLN